VQLLCDDFMRRVNTATVAEQDMTVGTFWEERYLTYREEIVKMTGESRNKTSTIRAALVPARSFRAR
jgi:hypothetical protein